MKIFFPQKHWIFLIGFLLFFLGLEILHQRLELHYFSAEEQMMTLTQKIQKQIALQEALQKHETTVKDLLGTDNENVWSKREITRFLKKIAYQNKLQNFRVLFLKEKTLHESAQFVIKCFSIRLQWLCVLDDHFFSFLKMLQEMQVGYTWAHELSLEKSLDDENESLHYQKDIVCLKGVYFFDWYAIVSR